MSRVRLLVLMFAFALGGDLVPSAGAASYYWVGGGSSASAPAGGNWDNATTDWSTTVSGLPTTAWGANGSIAVFGGVDGTYNVSVNATVNKPQILQFTNSGYTLLNSTTPQTLTFNSTGSGAAPNIQVASGKVATIGTNITVVGGGTTIWGSSQSTPGGELDIENGGKLTSVGSTIGMVGAGTVTSVKTGGTLVHNPPVAASFILGSQSSDDCTLRVDGGSVAIQGSSTTFKVGGSGTGTSLTGTLIVNDGTFTQAAGSSVMAVGLNTGNNGYVYLNGGKTIVNQIKQGGGPVGSGTGYVIFNGGTLRAAGGSFASTFLTGLSLAPIRNNGGIIDNNGFNITVGQALLNSLSTGFFPSDNSVDGGLIVTNSGSGGSLILTGANSYNGPTTIKSGAYLATTTLSTGPVPTQSMTMPRWKRKSCHPARRWP